MNSRPFALLTTLAFASLAPLPAVAAQTGAPPGEYYENEERFSANQLDNLVGPIALYPDALLAQVLVASTFPDQVEEAARYVRLNGTAGIDEQSWDVSVKAVAHYASALNMMSEKGDWTATLGRAYAMQSSDVMASVQRMRAMADRQGNLVSTAQQQVVNEGDGYVIAPAQARVIYVPVYDPVVVYTRPIFNVGFASRYWSFGIGFPIGGWLTYDLDWRRRTVYYNGWNDAFYSYGGGWRARSRPFIQITNVYVNPRYQSVYVNRNVYRHPVNYRNVDRYRGVHRDVYFAGRRDGYRDGYRDGRDRDDDRRPGSGYYPRTAQPRETRAVATPEGYRRPGSGYDNRTAPSRVDPSRGDQSRGQPSRGVASRDERGNIAAPRDRRNEPASPSRAILTNPDERGARPSRGSERSEPARRAEPRGPSPSAQPRGEPPRMPESRAQQPRIESRRAESSRGTPSRSAQPRSAQSRGGEPRD